jgi:hypothetical protein
MRAQIVPERCHGDVEIDVLAIAKAIGNCLCWTSDPNGYAFDASRLHSVPKRATTGANNHELAVRELRHSSVTIDHHPNCVR